jgi:hypothetical protein
MLQGHGFDSHELLLPTVVLAEVAMTREGIIRHLAEILAGAPAVHAVWLEGADATGSTDEHSDIDIVTDVDDGQEASVLALVRNALAEFGSLDYVSAITTPTSGLRHQVLHIEGTPAPWLIDVVVQSHSRDFTFTRGHPSEVPRVLFDRSGVVQFRDTEAAALAAEIEDRTRQFAKEFRPTSRIAKYVRRGQFLEALGAYRKFLLEPLVELLRLRYCPLAHDYGLVHISKHLPTGVVERLERLHAVTSVTEIAEQTEVGEEWFWEIVQALRKG